jgi:hypothetical protein
MATSRGHHCYSPRSYTYAESAKRYSYYRACAHEFRNGFTADKDSTETQGLGKDHPAYSVSEIFLKSRLDIAHLRGG